MSKTNIGLVEYAKSKINLPTIYMLGGFGRKLTGAMIDSRINRGCAHTKRNEARIRQGIGAYCFDCVGLIKGYLWEKSLGVVYYNIPSGSDQNVGMMWRSARRTGTLETMPDIIGLLVFTGDLGHVGIYIGKNTQGEREYIEATPAFNAWGVTKSNDKIRKWTHWGEYHLIEYVQPKPEPKPAQPLKVGDEVIVNGHLFKDSQGNGMGRELTDMKLIITIIREGAKKPYHVGRLGWVGSDSIKRENAPIAPKVYIVKRGDTMSGIARSLKVTLAHLIEKNPQIKNPNLIKPNDKIFY